MNVIIIPSYQPDNHLVDLVKDIKALTKQPIIVVNDGSNKDYELIFNQTKRLGCILLNHDVNQGKGASIKTAIKYAIDHFENLSGVITADADYQHLPKDIIRVSNELDKNPESLVLGSRNFTGDDVPKKSKFGNRFSALYFKLATNVSISDTQTGLRGIPKCLLNKSLSIKENRYDYEMTFLIDVAKSDTCILEYTIETVYRDNNNHSHFRPIVDSYRIYKRPIRFAISSLLSAFIDLSIFTILTMILNNEIATLVLISTITARIVSGIFNFTVNKRWSFESDSPFKKSFFKYFLLYILQLSLSILFVLMLSNTQIHLTIIKLFVDGCLFIASYFVQKNWVFKKTGFKQKTHTN